jgi:HK97 family phage major capsid protein/HK97 family phage prohead protease
VEPKGASFELPLPLLWQHDSSQPIGHVTHAKVTDDGIEIKARLVKIDEAGPLKDRLDTAWQSMKSGLVRGLSIGFKVLDAEPIKGTSGIRFLKWAWHELSAVTIPANAEASVTAIKQLDDDDLALKGFAGRVVEHSTPPAVVGRAPVKLHKVSSPVAHTYSEQIKNFENTRAANVARMDAIQQACATRGEGKTDAEREEFDTLRDQLKGIDQELVDLRELEKAVTVKAVVAPTPVAASAARDTHSVITVKQDLPPGIGLARSVMAQIQARKEYRSITDIVKERWPSDNRLHAFVSKASVPPGMTTVEAWAGAIAEPTTLSSEFVEYLRPRTIVGRIPGLKRVPFNVRYMGQNTGAVAQWVGQGKGKPVTSFSVFDGTLLRTKIAAIAVITEELARDSSPAAETLVRDELAKAVIERLDTDFIDPAQAASAGVNPASITYGVTPLSPSGVTEALARADLITLLSQFAEQNVDPTNLVLIMPNTLALALSLMVNSLGQASFPGVSPQGGTLLGIPVVASQYAANASGSGNLVIALNASDIFLADDGQVTLDASREASIQMTDTPTVDASTSTGQSLVSMYQTNCIAVRAERFVNWAKVRSTAVVFMDDVNWGSVGSPS